VARPPRAQRKPNLRFRPKPAQLRALGAVARDLRGSRSRNDVARSTKLKTDTLRSVELGLRWTSFTVLNVLAQEYRVPIEDLAHLVAPPRGRWLRQRIDHHRVRRGMSLEDLASASRLSSALLLKIRAGDVTPGQAEFGALVDTLTPGKPAELLGSTSSAKIKAKNTWHRRAERKPSVNRAALLLGPGLREARRQEDLRQQDVVDRMEEGSGVVRSASVVGNYERGQSFPPPPVAASIEGAVGLERGTLIPLPDPGHTFKQRLHYYMALRGLDQNQLGRRAKLRSVGDMISRYLAGKAQPRHRVMVRLARVLRVRVAQLDGSDPNP
jgi:transcriptional regulator with XRE-family HTH domain